MTRATEQTERGAQAGGQGGASAEEPAYLWHEFCIESDKNLQIKITITSAICNHPRNGSTGWAVRRGMIYPCHTP